jgi:hypothetical protein
LLLLHILCQKTRGNYNKRKEPDEEGKLCACCLRTDSFLFLLTLSEAATGAATTGASTATVKATTATEAAAAEASGAVTMRRTP